MTPHPEHYRGLCATVAGLRDGVSWNRSPESHCSGAFGSAERFWVSAGFALPVQKILKAFGEVDKVGLSACLRADHSGPEQ